MRPSSLTCEYLVNPLGLDVSHPHLSWKLEQGRIAHFQTAWQIQIAGDASALANGQADLWDSGQVTGDNTLFIKYGGRPLESRQRCYWRVRYWTKTTALRTGAKPPGGRWVCSNPPTGRPNGSAVP